MNVFEAKNIGIFVIRAFVVQFIIAGLLCSYICLSILKYRFPSVLQGKAVPPSTPQNRLVKLLSLHCHVLYQQLSLGLCFYLEDSQRKKHLSTLML